MQEKEKIEKEDIAKENTPKEEKTTKKERGTKITRAHGHDTTKKLKAR